MASAKTFLADGGITKKTYFVNEYYDLWKTRMQMFLKTQGDEV